MSRSPDSPTEMSRRGDGSVRFISIHDPSESQVVEGSPSPQEGRTDGRAEMGIAMETSTH